MSKTNIRRVIVIFIMILIFLTGAYLIMYGGYTIYNATNNADVYDKFNQNYKLKSTVLLKNVDVNGKKINFKFVRKIDKAVDAFIIAGYYNNKKIYEEHSRVINFDVKKTNDSKANTLIFIDTASSVGQLGDKVLIYDQDGKEVFNMIMNKYSFDDKTGILTLDEFNVLDDSDNYGSTSATKYQLKDGKFKIVE